MLRAMQCVRACVRAVAKLWRSHVEWKAGPGGVQYCVQGGHEGAFSMSKRHGRECPRWQARRALNSWHGVIFAVDGY